MEDRFAMLYNIAWEHQPASVRHIYYRAVVAGVVEKTEKGYAKVQRALSEMRVAGMMPFGWIVDSTRWQRRPRSFDDLEACLTETARLYRRNLWAGLDERVEVWAESDSIAGVLVEVTAKWNVPLMVTKGFSSITFAHSAVETWNNEGLPVTVYYVGDHDPAGLDIERKLGEYIDEWCDVDVDQKRVGVTWAQVEAFELPGGPPKREYGYPLAVEAEALPPGVLRELLDDAIAQHVDPDDLERLEIAERSEREILDNLANWRRT